MLSEATCALGTDNVDLVDLRTASGLLRFRAAREGLVVFQSTPGIFDEFAVAAALHWYDVEPVVRRAQHGLLAEM